ncbi:hypothetical protein AMATHDRAFT_151147 [Amanita thiersii Skay4041]|uniref:Integral membrane bound transporter domain-containing protein n=1 Tax=Amanita thiersii Skay4041 TaxID=703135 RepID=A0A2A9NJG6_9AGAR|nr:hypothetical protein AMATHDRAFT_151147 [Amanita thiersii Skay4041]
MTRSTGIVSALRGLFHLCSARQFRARLLSTVICAVLVVFQPFSQLGGPSAFLALTVKELVFSVQENLAEQVEVTFLHSVGGLFGIGWSALGRFLASLAEEESLVSRMVPALFLVGICFIAGWLKSRLPRLTKACRIACFISIWLLTENVGHEENTLQLAGNYLWITMTAALTTLICSLLLLQWSSTQLARDIAHVMSLIHDCLQSQLRDGPEDATTPPRSVMSKQLMEKTMALHPVYQQASFELRIGRVGVKVLKPLIVFVEHLRRELSAGMTYPRVLSTDTSYELHVIEQCSDPSIQLGRAVLASLKAIETIVLTCFEGPWSVRSLETEKEELYACSTQLSNTSAVARDRLKNICDDLYVQQRTFDSSVEFPDKVLDLCSHMISLLQMAHNVQHALSVVNDIVTTYEASSLKLWHPRFTFAWLGMAPNAIMLDGPAVFVTEDEGQPIPTTALSLQETMHGIAERQNLTDYLEDDNGLNQIHPFFLSRKHISPFWWRPTLYHLLNHSWMMRVRLSLSNFLRALQRSPHLKHAVKNAAGAFVLAVAAFLPTGDPGRVWFEKSIGQWMVISYVWVLETNTGATFRVAYLRLMGTVAGALYAYLGCLITNNNPYGLVVAAAAAEFPISWVIMKTRYAAFGSVASVTLPPILFLPYFRPGTSPVAWKLAVFRSAMNAVGIVAALMMNSLVFPRHCRVMFLNCACRTLGLLIQLYMAICRDLFQSTQPSSSFYRRKILRLETDIRKMLYGMSILLATMEDELSLIPKPVMKYRHLCNVLQQLLDIFTGLRKIRENLPKRDISARTQRREFVSCVCMSLFASEQVFRSRQPLPQFFPSPKLALRTLENVVEANIELFYRRDPSEGQSLTLIYVFAELDALAKLVDTVDELLDLTRQLFGTAGWNNGTPTSSATFASFHEEVTPAISRVSSFVHGK